MEAKQKSIHADVIDRCIAGDEIASHSLYDLYSKAMFNICYRMCNSKEEAEDVLQEAFLKAFANLDKYKGTASFGAWLKRIVVNTAINQIRKKQITLVPLDEVGTESVETDFADDQDLYLNVERIREGIEKLPDGYRIVFSLYLMDGYDHNEISQILGITESTSKSQYNRAKNKLRSILMFENNERGYAAR